MKTKSTYRFEDIRTFVMRRQWLLNRTQRRRGEFTSQEWCERQSHTPQSHPDEFYKKPSWWSYMITAEEYPKLMERQLYLNERRATRLRSFMHGWLLAKQ
jgi:hypothetical protein